MENHSLGVQAKDKSILEAVSPRFLEAGLLEARRKTIALVESFGAHLKAGMTEDDARRLALELATQAGVTKHWHKAYVRFGPGTLLTFHEELQKEYRLQAGNPFYVDLGPVWFDESGLGYEGDYGDTFVFGQNPAATQCAEFARTLFKRAQAFWRETQASGQKIYEFLETQVVDTEYRLVEAVEGHRVADFPHHQYSKATLSEFECMPAANLWILEVQIAHRKLPFGAFFEDLL